MVWYGVIWYGMLWCGMVWYGIVCYGMVLYSMVWPLGPFQTKRAKTSNPNRIFRVDYWMLWFGECSRCNKSLNGNSMIMRLRWWGYWYCPPVHGKWSTKFKTKQATKTSNRTSDLQSQTHLECPWCIKSWLGSVWWWEWGGGGSGTVYQFTGSDPPSFRQSGELPITPP